MKKIKWFDAGPILIIILVVLASILLNSCATQKKCFAKFPPDTVTKFEQIHVVEYRDTIVPVFIPGDSVFVETVIPCPDITIEPITARVPFAHATASVNESRLSLQLIQHDTTLQHMIDSIRSTVDTVKITETVIVEKPAPKKKTSPWLYVSLTLFVSLIVIILALVILK